MNQIFSIIISIICGLFGSLGGSGLKQFRTLGISFFLATVGLFYNIYNIIILLWIPIFYIGYGVPSESNKGSVLGRFWYSFWKNNKKLADIFTKLTISLIFSFVLLLIGIIKGSLLVLLLTIHINIISQIVFGGLIESLGSIKIFGKEVNIIEIFRYGLLGLAGIIQIMN
jgi:hypothetical protein